MNIKNPILIELESLAPTLINVPRTLPYTIRNGYFDNLSTNILNRFIVQNKLITDSFTIDGEIILTPFVIPDGYFSGFANSVLAKIKAETNDLSESIIPDFVKNPYQVPYNYFNNLSSQILEKISLLENENYGFGNKLTPYQIPAGYFNNLSNEILLKIEESSNEILNTNFTKTNPYQAPVGYFEGFSNEILLKVNPAKTQDVPNGYFAALPNIILQKVRGLEVKNELEQIAPLLNTINKFPVNHVPVGYFETLQPVLPLPQIVPAKVIGIKKKINWFKNAIAACLIGTLGFTAFQLMDASNSEPKTIQTLSKEEIPVEIPTSNINVDEELSKVDDTSLAKYLDNIEMPTEQATAHFNDVNSGDVDDALQDISDETIQQHLDETGGLTNKNN